MYLADFLFFNAPYSETTVIGCMLLGVTAGFLIRSAIVFKQRKRILRLEDEMLSNHARILSLEKRVSEAKKEHKSSHDYEVIAGGKMERVS
jgi:hypothetical protein